MNEYELIGVQTLPIEEVDKPKVVYKYRSWNIGEAYDDRVLTHNQLYMSEPVRFKDKLDCRVPIRYDLMSDKEIYLWSIKMAKRDHPRYNEDTINKIAIEALDRLPFRDEVRLKHIEEQEWISYNQWAGVLCLCMQSLNLRMWEEYGNNHKGICYGFHTNELILSCNLNGGAEVQYVDPLPVILPSMELMVQSGLKAYYKRKEYIFEEEYRLRTFNPNNKNPSNRIKVYPNEALAEVTLGKDFDPSSISKIINILLAKNSNAILYKCLMKNGSLIREEINYRS